MARHGFRNPGDDDIIEMKRRGEEIKEAIIQNSYKNGRKYKTLCCPQNVQFIYHINFNN